MTQPTIAKEQINMASLYQYNGTAGWDDYVASLANGQLAGANDPGWSQLRDGIYAFTFSPDVVNEVWVTFHITHGYAVGTDIFPHVHWTTNAATTGTVRWGVEYTVAKGYSREAFPATTTIYFEQAAPAVAYMHMIAEGVGAPDVIPANLLETDAIVLCRVFRDAAHANDTCPDAVYGLMCDLHHQTAQPNTKNRNYPFD